MLPAAMMPKKSRPLNLDDFDAIDWDYKDDPIGNYAHCAEHGIDERVVDEVLSGDWVSIEIPVDTAEFAIVGPNAKANFMWTLLFDTSWKRGDWLRPVTGWDSRPKDIREWEKATGRQWKGSGQKVRRRR
jgi:hypothetical protein